MSQCYENHVSFKNTTFSCRCTTSFCISGMLHMTQAQDIFLYLAHYVQVCYLSYNPVLAKQDPVRALFLCWYNMFLYRHYMFLFPDAPIYKQSQVGDPLYLTPLIKTRQIKKARYFQFEKLCCVYAISLGLTMNY